MLSCGRSSVARSACPRAWCLLWNWNTGRTAQRYFSTTIAGDQRHHPNEAGRRSRTRISTTTYDRQTKRRSKGASERASEQASRRPTEVSESLLISTGAFLCQRFSFPFNHQEHLLRKGLLISNTPRVRDHEIRRVSRSNVEDRSRRMAARRSREHTNPQNRSSRPSTAIFHSRRVLQQKIHRFRHPRQFGS